MTCPNDKRPSEKKHGFAIRSIVITCYAFAILVFQSSALLAEQHDANNGHLNVRDFGAKGDGINDDTLAIRAAISKLPKFDSKQPFRVQPIYFPDGIYRITDTIVRKDENGNYQPALTLLGQSRDKTIIRLSDHTAGFNDAQKPKALIFFASGLLGANAYAGGKHYPELGEGNDAYQNNAENLTIDVGGSNPGAIGIDYLANNIGALRRLNVIASSASGHTGISLRRKWIGPALLGDIAITGFDFGITVENTQYGIVLDHVKIDRTRVIGLRNISNLVSFSELSINPTDGIGIANIGPQALLVGRNGTVTGKGHTAVQNQGYMNLKNIETTSFEPLSKKDRLGRIEGVFASAEKIADSQWALPVPPTPQIAEQLDGDWADITKYGASSDPATDSTAGIQLAMASGKSTIYFPNGVYRISSQIQIPRTVSRVEGTWSTIKFDMRTRGTDRAPALTIASREHPLLVRRFVFDNSKNSAKLLLLQNTSGKLLLQDITAGGIQFLDRSATGGEVFMENISVSGMTLSGTAGVWIRQLNTEGRGVRIGNNGTPLWILGSKTEQNMTLLENINGAHTEIHGGFVYMVHFNEPKRPYLVNVGGTITAALAEEAFFPNTAYEVLLNSTMSGRVTEIRGVDLPIRHHTGRMAPQISTEQ